MKWLNERKRYLGIIAGGILGIAVSTDWASWSDQWVQIVATVIGLWTGVAINHKVNKATKGK